MPVVLNIWVASAQRPNCQQLLYSKIKIFDWKVEILKYFRLQSSLRVNQVQTCLFFWQNPHITDLHFNTKELCMSKLARRNEGCFNDGVKGMWQAWAGSLALFCVVYFLGCNTSKPRILQIFEGILSNPWLHKSLPNRKWTVIRLSPHQITKKPKQLGSKFKSPQNRNFCWFQNIVPGSNLT